MKHLSSLTGRVAACRRVATWLPGFVGGELRAEQLEFVRTHLIHCAPCRGVAGSHLRAHKALQAAAAADCEAAPGGSHAWEAMHDGLHAAILERVAVAQDAADEGPSWSLRTAVLAAAVLLAAFGFWLAAERDSSSIWQRPGLSAPSAGGGLRAVPWSGPRVDLRPVGLDPAEFGGSAENGYGPGMMGRGRLRTAIDEEFVLPVIEPGGR